MTDTRPPRTEGSPATADGGTLSGTTTITRAYRDGELVAHGFPLHEVSDHLETEGCHVWVDFTDPTAGDLAAKLAFMIEHDMSDGMDWLEELHADARRIAGLEG